MNDLKLDLNLLKNGKQKGDDREYQCPACAEEGRDKTGNHLVVYASGKFGCAVNAGDTQHRKRIFELVGVRDKAKPQQRRACLPVAAPKASEVPAPLKLAPMPANERGTWEAGVLALFNDAATCTAIDNWRAWDAGTARTLAEGSMMGTPIIYGKPCTAFSVVDSHGVEVGYHARLKPKSGDKADWYFHPKGTPALPFVLGGGHAPNAREVFVLEGQWDAVCLASAAGWLEYDTAWPDHVMVFGTRGAGGWRKLIDSWLSLIPKSARFTIFPDEDATGDTWSKSGGFRDTLAAHGYNVRTVKTGHKDFTECHQAKPIAREYIQKLLGRAAS